MDGFAHGCADPALALYERLLSPSWLEDRRRELGLRGGGGLFTSSLTIWLGVRSRMEGGLCVEDAWLSCPAEEARRLSPKSARAKSGKLSAYASGYDYARHSLPLSLVLTASDRLLQEARALLKPETPGWFLLDGSSLTLPHSPSLAKAFPPLANQHGPTHWPIVKTVLAHDLATGLSVRPEWGPMYGKYAVSEQFLAHKVIERLPSGSGVIADCAFGVFQIVWAIRDRPMLVRMSDNHSRKFAPEGLEQDIDVPRVWTPSQSDAKSSPHLPKDASVSGRFIIRHVLGPKGKVVRVCLFTNDLVRSADELVLFYTRRWDIETDFRSLKHTVGIEIIRAKTPDMVAKELILAVCAYNIVRTVMALAAAKAGVEPRNLSFARAKACIEIFARRGNFKAENVDELLKLIAGRKLPERKLKRHYPREVWKHHSAFSSRKVEGKE